MPATVLRRLTTVLAVAAMAFGAVVVSPQSAAFAQSGGFNDVPDDAYYTTPVADLAAAGVFAGTGCDEGFCPGEAIDRKTMAVWTVRVLTGGDPSPIAQSRFIDIDPSTLHAPFIEKMAELGITTGCGEGTEFCPERSVTRAQMAVLLSRAYGLPDGPDPNFSDIPEAAWYAADVARLFAAGITTGCGDGTGFCPSKSVTRGQMATFLQRAGAYSAEATDQHQETMNFEDLPSSDTFVSVSAGYRHSCGLRTDATIACWGNNLHGKSDVPAGTFAAVSAGERHSCAIRTDQTIVCWGERFAAGPAVPLGTFTAVSAGGSHSCAIRPDKTIACWGNNYSGQSDAPTGLFYAVSAGYRHSCGLRTDQTITCWGNNDLSQSNAPTGTFISMSTGLYHSCGVKADQTATCWGGPRGTDDNDLSQVDQPAGSFTLFSAGDDNYSCGLRVNQTITCWWHLIRGDQGYTLLDAAAGHQLAAPGGYFIAISTGEGHACGLRLDQTITCWGDDYWIPLNPSADSFTAVTSGEEHSCAINASQTVICWEATTTAEQTLR